MAKDPPILPTEGGSFTLQPDGTLLKTSGQPVVEAAPTPEAPTPEAPAPAPVVDAAPQPTPEAPAAAPLSQES
jgi:hypothetical protein